MDHPCPVCEHTISSRELAGQPRRRPYRICPSCGAQLTVDPDTKRRQLVALALALLALVMVASAAAWGSMWTIVGTVSSCVALGGWILHSERRVRFLPYGEPS